MDPHDWETIFITENQAGSRDILLQCKICRIVKHDYEYPMGGDRNNMAHSPNYPTYHPCGVNPNNYHTIEVIFSE